GAVVLPAHLARRVGEAARARELPHAAVAALLGARVLRRAAVLPREAAAGRPRTRGAFPVGGPPGAALRQRAARAVGRQPAAGRDAFRLPPGPGGTPAARAGRRAAAHRLHRLDLDGPAGGRLGRRRGGMKGIAAALVLSSSLAASAGDPAARHLIYLHGRIVQEQQSARPKHPEFGYYELDQIVKTFEKRGFTVTDGIRPKGATLDESA